MSERQILFRYVYQHKDSGEIRTEDYTLQQIEQANEEDLLFVMECDCEPIGETNVIECNCEDYFDGFHLIDRLQFTGKDDKNGKKIFEGNIVDPYHGEKYSCPMEVKWNEELGGWQLKRVNGNATAYVFGYLISECEIVGTIHGK